MTDTNSHCGLRERKKARTRASIRVHALRLFRDHGYHATTVEQIAAAADVSPSTFFRYFPTKEDVVLQNDMDARVLDAFARQPAKLAPLPAIRAAMVEAFQSFSPQEWEQIAEGSWLSMSVPEIRQRSMNEFARTINAISDALAERTGRDATDLPVRVLAGSVVGAVMAVFLPAEIDDDGGAPLPPGTGPGTVGPESVARIQRALALLEAGLPV